MYGIRVEDIIQVNQAVFLSHRMHIFIRKFPLNVVNNIGELLFTASALPCVILFSDLH